MDRRKLDPGSLAGRVAGAIALALRARCSRTSLGRMILQKILEIKLEKIITKMIAKFEEKKSRFMKNLKIIKSISPYDDNRDGSLIR